MSDGGVLSLTFGDDSNEADKALLGWLHSLLGDENDGRALAFISDETRKKLIKANSDFICSSFQDQWSGILIDAFRFLKINDKGECPKGADDSAVSFFNEESLGVQELERILKSFADFEGVLYGASPDRYRDHIAHVCRVWIFGAQVIEKLFRNKLQINIPIDKDSVSAKEWQAMWAIAALCHDLGYPLSGISKVNDLARKSLGPLGLAHGSDLRFDFSSQILPFHHAIIQMMASTVGSRCELEEEKRYVTRLQWKYYLKYLKSFDLKSHGIVSALLIAKASVFFLETDYTYNANSQPLAEDDVKRFFIRREILRAITDHTCPDIYHVNYNSLSFLLFLVDEIQFWGRPTFEQMQSQDQSMTEKVIGNANKFPEILKCDLNVWDDKNMELEITIKEFVTANIKTIKKQLDNMLRILRMAYDTSGCRKGKFKYVFKGMHRGMRGRLALVIREQEVGFIASEMIKKLIVDVCKMEVDFLND